jgi:hypothetical protein
MNVTAIENPLIIVVVPLSSSICLVMIDDFRVVIVNFSPHHHQGILSSSSIHPLIKCPVVIMNLCTPHY